MADCGLDHCYFHPQQQRSTDPKLNLPSAPHPPTHSTPPTPYPSRVSLVVKHRRNEGEDASSSALDYILERLKVRRRG